MAFAIDSECETNIGKVRLRQAPAIYLSLAHSRNPFFLSRGILISELEKTDIVHKTKYWRGGNDDDDVVTNSEISMWRVQSHKWGIDYRLFPSTNVLFTKQ